MTTNVQLSRGVPGRSFEHRIPDPEVRATIGRRALAGEQVERLAAEFGVSASTVRRYRDAAGEVSV
ncbi:MAG: helix-turn-helix domain-containing protein [Mycobacterium sp.]|nr:helix-turn-helix domain-containing protein [Mycobacterium sp.]